MLSLSVGVFLTYKVPAVRYRVLTLVLRIAVCWFFQNGEMRSQESNYMYSSFTKSTIKNQNTQLTEKSVGITIRMFPDYPIEKAQYPINKKISGYYPIHQNFLSGALRLRHCFSVGRLNQEPQQGMRLSVGADSG